MSENFLIDYCSPTLAGIKTASLMSIKYETVNEARDDIRDMNRIFVNKGLRAVPLKFKEGRVLIYVYRPSFLKRDLQHSKAIEALSELGYDCSNIDKCIVNLALRMQHSVDFPHEIGFFLGYPPGDVLGFIKHSGKSYKCCGMWKVYDDEDHASKMFFKFDHCRDCYLNCWKNGKKIDELTVSTAI